MVLKETSSDQDFYWHELGKPSKNHPMQLRKKDFIVLLSKTTYRSYYELFLIFCVIFVVEILKVTVVSL